MLKYAGTSFLPGVPARDLSDAEARFYGRTKLLQSGIYFEVYRKPKRVVVAEPILLDKEHDHDLRS